jgi:hypothetical protein
VDDTIAEASAAEVDKAATAKTARGCLALRSADAVGMDMVAMPARSVEGELTVGFARAAAAADCKPPSPGKRTVGFPVDLKAPAAALMAPATEVAVGVSMGAARAWAAAERVLDAADRKPPFPGDLKVGFLGESKEPTAALTGVLPSVASGMEKRGGDKEAARLPDGLGAIGVEGAVLVVCRFLSALVALELGG